MHRLLVGGYEIMAAYRLQPPECRCKVEREGGAAPTRHSPSLCVGKVMVEGTEGDIGVGGWGKGALEGVWKGLQLGDCSTVITITPPHHHVISPWVHKPFPSLQNVSYQNQQRGAPPPENETGDSGRRREYNRGGVGSWQSQLRSVLKLSLLHKALFGN